MKITFVLVLGGDRPWTNIKRHSLFKQDTYYSGDTADFREDAIKETLYVDHFSYSSHSIAVFEYTLIIALVYRLSNLYRFSPYTPLGKLHGGYRSRCSLAPHLDYLLGICQVLKQPLFNWGDGREVLYLLAFGGSRESGLVWNQVLNLGATYLGNAV